MGDAGLAGEWDAVVAPAGRLGPPEQAGKIRARRIRTRIGRRNAVLGVGCMLPILLGVYWQSSQLNVLTAYAQAL